MNEKSYDYLLITHLKKFLMQQFVRYGENSQASLACCLNNWKTIICNLEQKYTLLKFIPNLIDQKKTNLGILKCKKCWNIKKIPAKGLVSFKWSFADLENNILAFFRVYMVLKAVNWQSNDLEAEKKSSLGIIKSV